MSDGPKKVVKVVKTQPKKEEVQKQVPVTEEPLKTETVPVNEPEKNIEQPVYKKWWFWLIAAAFVLGVIALLYNGSNKSGNNATTDSGDVAVATVAETTAEATTEPVNTFNAEEVLNQLQINTYTYSGKYSDGEHYVMQLKNNSEYTLDVSISATYFDASNNMVGTDQDTEYDVPAGKEFIMDFYNDSKFDRAEHTISVKETNSYEPLAQNLSIESQNIAGDKVVFTVKNNGDKAIEFPKVTALFFKGDQLVDTDYTYAEPDGSSALEAGQTINKELDSYGTDFDRVLLFTMGRSDYTF